MTEFNLVTLSGSKLVNGVPVVEATTSLDGSGEDLQPYGDIELIMGLGMAACPAPANDDGQAQGVVCENLAGANAVCVGAIDRRNASVYGKLGPGDTAVFATGPKGVSQCLLKAEKRQAILATLGSDDTQVMVVLDGKNDKIQFVGFGALLELSKKNGWTMLDDTGKGFHLQDGVMHMTADLHIGAPVPNPMKLMAGPPTGSPGSVASVPLLPVKGISFSP